MNSPHLFLQLFDADVEAGEVVSHRPRPGLQELSDLQLQLGVGLLQGAHLLQVGGQAVVEVLHGGLLVDSVVVGHV